MTRRRPPYDAEAEQSLCASLIIYPARIPNVAQLVTAADFYNPSLAHVYSAIIELASTNEPIDTVTVAARLNGHGDDVDLDQLITEASGISNPGAYAEIISSLSRRRQAQSAALELDAALQEPGVDLVRTLADHLARVERIGHSAHTSTAWQPVDLSDALLGVDTDRPALLTRLDGRALLYPGKTHAFNGESESLKSWLALHGVAQELAAGQSALYVDFEDNAHSVVGRLLALGVAPSAILDRFLYLRPDEPVSTAGTMLDSLLEQRRPTIAVVDGVTEAMALHGLDLKDNLDYARFHAAIPKRLAACGAAVSCIDHVTKSKEDRGRFALGAQHKLAAIDGAAYTIEVLTPFGRGRTGTAQITVAKDRPGAIREFAAYGKIAGVLTLTSDRETGAVTAQIAPPTTVDTATGVWPTKIMEKVSRIIEEQPAGLTKNAIKGAAKGDDKKTTLAIELLINAGHIKVETGKNRAQIHTSIKPYREPSPEEMPQ